MDSPNNFQVVDNIEQFPRHVHGYETTRCLFPKMSLDTKLLSSLGAHELLRIETWKGALTELVATASLMFTLTTSIIACLDSHEVDPKFLVPFAVFIITFLFLIVTVPISGGHMNPVFTFIATLKGLITLSRALIYMLAQCMGSIIGFFIIKSVMDPKLVQIYSLGGCVISGIKQQQALLLEFSCTFVVLFIGITLAFDKKKSKDLGLPMVCLVVAGAMGLAVFVSITVTGQVGYAGVGLNPARCLGPALVYGGPLWNGHWVFWVGPFLACMGYYAVSINLPKEGLVLVDGEYDVLKLAMGSCGNINVSNVAVSSDI
ncbi:PREDICTED: aquaporin PIP-type-like [Lupinus angustifolius]|uniref:aquaporin PIP-type-like n=1 Tax=Lupinus angustifolius TaxID=3871 RepID=UPI00092EC77A|nr:PREDICTED: aquaporin PIP-type-like [Lupinus angustifolius]